MNLDGRAFEAIILERSGHLEDEGILTLRRNGVMAAHMKNAATGQMEWIIKKSFPDFSGAIAPHGRELIIEAKVCSQASYALCNTDKKSPRQISHMLERSRFGSLCFLIIHWNERVLIRSTQEAVTTAIPVERDAIIWREYDCFQRRTISRDEALTYGLVIPWNLWSTRASKLTPDLRVLINSVPQPELQLT